jgi:hypothetical protein
LVDLNGRYGIVSLAILAIMALSISGCGGELSRSGWGKIVKVGQDGSFSVAYPNGNVSPKRLSRDSSHSDYRRLVANRLKPAKVVETPDGGTITFTDGETIRFDEVQRGQ